MNRLVKAILLLVISIFLFQNSYAEPDSGFKPKFKPTIKAPRVQGNIKIDGQLNESIWKEAAVADNFAEINPGDQIKPPVDSKALIAYDDNNLYVALIAFDDPSTIRTSYRDRDQIFRDDYFGIMLDTYNNQGWGYELFVNPYGIQGDLRMNSDGNEDMSFDIIWESIGKVTDSGYQVEIVVPFASLRFPDKDKQTWRVNFWRDHQRETRRRYAWAAQDRDDPCFICQFGYLEGIENIKPGNNLEIMPSAIGFQNGYRSDPDTPSSEFINDDPDGEASVNLRYGLNSNSSLEATYNPDFSQVESDEAQIDVNTTLGLFFNESRPFFQEGSELYNTWINAVYTRSVNDPKAATKFTGQFGKTSIAYMFARDENSPVLVPLRQQTAFAQADKSFVNIFRVRQAMEEDTYVGFLMTDRRLDDFGANDMHKGGANTVFGFDGLYRIFGKYQFEAQVLFSHTEEIIDAHPTYYELDSTLIDTTNNIYQYDSTEVTDDLISASNQEYFDRDKRTIDFDGEKFWGEAFYLSFERHSRLWNFDIDYYATSPTFRADNGFITSNDYREISAWTGLEFRPNKKFLLTWEPSISVGRKWKYHGEMDITSYNNAAFDEWISLELYTYLMRQTDFSISYVNSQENFFGKNLPGISRITLYLYSRFNELVNFGIQYKEGKTVYRKRSDPDLGYEHSIYIFGSLKPSERLYIEPSFNYSAMDRRNSYFDDPSHAGENKQLFDASVSRIRISYQFSRRLFLRLVMQYVDQTVYDHSLNESDELVLEKYKYSNFTVDPLITFKINPFTKFYIGMSSSYDAYQENYGLEQTIDNKSTLNNRQFFAKFQYLIRM